MRANIKKPANLGTEAKGANAVIRHEVALSDHDQVRLERAIALEDHANAATTPNVRDLQDKLARHFDCHGELLRQAEFARAIGSSFVAAVLEAGYRQLHRAPLTQAFISEWPGDPSAAAMAMRFNAALHALARRGQPASLQALYRRTHHDFDGAIGEVLAQEDAFIAGAMRYPTQTNEVSRAAAIISALMVVACETGLPFELLEMGSSCGLNLNLDRYAYDLGGVSAGTPGSPVMIAPDWRGVPPPYAPVTILAARGVDLHPLDPNAPSTVERLTSYVWADQPARLKRLEQALLLARSHSPQIDRGDALPWLVDRLNASHQDGVCRVVFHSMVLQYFSVADRQAAIEAIQGAGNRASSRRPFAWISFEWTPTRSEVRLMLTSWPGGKTRHLATCHPYGAWIEWMS